MPHPEGGFFKETYRSEERVGSRSVSTAIYFLLPRGAISRLHRIRSDEVWHFYSGEPLVVVELHEGGARETILGPGHEVQHVVRGGTWFGAYPLGEYAFVGCTVAPGFDFADFEMGARAELLARYPAARDAIVKLTD